MTREEAIIELKRKITCTIGGLSKNEYNATVMAIEALKGGDAEMSPQTIHMQQSPSDGADLISRAEAIEAVRKKLQDWGGYAFEDYRRGLYEAQDIIEALPSADRPTKCIAEIKIDNDDLIKRIKEEYELADRPQGEWIFKDDYEPFAGQYFCSNCDTRAEVDLYGEWILSNYCPNCGAYMRGGDSK